MSEPLLQVRGLTKHFGSAGLFRRGRVVHAVEDVSLDVARGEVVGLVGESGSGKTTIARCALRLTEPTAGEIRFAGTDLRRLVALALGLYAIGVLASVSHNPMLAAVVYAAGIVVCAFAAWLSRGSDSEDPPGGEEPVDEQPPPEPDGVPRFEWDAFERDFRTYTERAPAGVD